MHQPSYIFQEQHSPVQPHQHLAQTLSSHIQETEEVILGKETPRRPEVPKDTPKSRMKTTNYEEKVDNFHMKGASEMKPSLFVTDGNASPIPPTTQEKFTLKPQFEPPADPTLQGQHARTLQLRHRDQLRQAEQRLQKTNKRASKEDVEAKNEQREGTRERRKRKLPEVVKQNGESNPIQISESSAIVLQNTERKPKKPQPTDNSFHHIGEESSETTLMKSMVGPVGSTTSYVFHRGGTFMNPLYTLKTPEGSQLISASKQSCLLSSCYTITSAQGQKTQAGYLRGNFSGSEFNLYLQHEGIGEGQLVATIVYRLNCSCWGQSFRYIDVYIKTAKQNDLVFEGVTRRKNLKELFQEGYSTHIEKISTEQPVWSKKHSCYILNFGGKGKLPSVKNMILVGQNGSRSLVFCKEQPNAFHLQLGSSISMFAAMGVLLSSFDFKLLCQ